MFLYFGCLDNTHIEELLHQLPEHLIIYSNKVRMLDISLGQGRHLLSVLNVCMIILSGDASLWCPLCLPGSYAPDLRCEKKEIGNAFKLADPLPKIINLLIP